VQVSQALTAGELERGAVGPAERAGQQRRDGRTDVVGLADAAQGDGTGDGSVDVRVVADDAAA
jgi:hypothetical protein